LYKTTDGKWASPGDPYKYDSFVYKSTEQPIYGAKEVDMINQKNKLFVINEIIK
jgi:hypothetical protein